MHRLWTLTFLLVLALHPCYGYLLHDECTVIVAGGTEGKKEATFSNIIHFDIARNNEHSNAVITIDDEETGVKIPSMNWTRVTCNLSNRKCNKDSDGDNGNDLKNEMDFIPKKRTIGIRNADVLFGCSKGLPNKKLTKDNAVDFPRSQKERETFVIVPEVEMVLNVEAFGEIVSLCWNGDKIAAKDSECPGLPPGKNHFIIVDFAAKKIQNANGEAFNQHKDESLDKEKVWFKTENGSAWIVQLMNETQRPETTTDPTATPDPQVGCAHCPGLIAAVVIFATSTLLLAGYFGYTKWSSNSGRMSSAGTPGLPVNPLTSGGHCANDIGEETENDIYIPFDRN